jgi:tetratricopeptide (TPR) repeat protein
MHPVKSNRAVCLALPSAVIAAILGGCAAASQDSAPDVQYLPGADYHLLMAEIALERGEYLTVAQEYLSAADQSSDPEIARRAAEYAFEYGYDAYALRAAQRWAALDPEDRRPHEYLSPLNLRRHDLDRALFHLRAMVPPTAQRTDDDYLGVEELLAGENELREVTTALVRLGAQRPDLAGARLAVARAALRSGSNDLALASARQAAAIDPDLFEARLLMARALFASGSTNAALAYLKELQQSQPNLAVELDYIRLKAAAGNIAPAMDALVALSERSMSASIISARSPPHSNGTGTQFGSIAGSGAGVIWCLPRPASASRTAGSGTCRPRSTISPTLLNAIRRTRSICSRPGPSCCRR